MSGCPDLKTNGSWLPLFDPSPMGAWGHRSRKPTRVWATLPEAYKSLMRFPHLRFLRGWLKRLKRKISPAQAKKLSSKGNTVKSISRSGRLFVSGSQICVNTPTRP